MKQFAQNLHFFPPEHRQFRDLAPLGIIKGPYELIKWISSGT